MSSKSCVCMLGLKSNRSVVNNDLSYHNPEADAVNLIFEQLIGGIIPPLCLCLVFYKRLYKENLNGTVGCLLKFLENSIDLVAIFKHQSFQGYTTKLSCRETTR